MCSCSKADPYQALEDSACLFDEVKLLDQLLCFKKKPTSKDTSDSGLRLEEGLQRAYFKSRRTSVGLSPPQWGLEYSPESSHATDVPTEEVAHEPSAHLFVAATWIYFERTIRCLVGLSGTLNYILDDAFHLLSQSLQDANPTDWSKYSPFSLFVIGIEARNDDERKLILDATALPTNDQAVADTQPLCVESAVDLIKKMWVKQDLYDISAGHFDYGAALHQVMSSCEKLPSLL